MKKSNKGRFTEDQKRLLTVIILIASMLILTMLILLAAGVFNGDKNDGGDTDGTSNVGLGTGNNSGSTPGSSITGSDNPIEGPLVDVEPD